MSCTTRALIPTFMGRNFSAAAGGQRRGELTCLKNVEVDLCIQFWKFNDRNARSAAAATYDFVTWIPIARR
jgi:hypothetical protein